MLDRKTAEKPLNKTTIPKSVNTQHAYQTDIALRYKQEHYAMKSTQQRTSERSTFATAALAAGTSPVVTANASARRVGLRSLKEVWCGLVPVADINGLRGDWICR